MSLGVNGISTSISSDSMLSQLQNMQDQMQSLTSAANTAPENRFREDTTPAKPVWEQEQTESTLRVQTSAAERVGVFEDLLKEALETVNNWQTTASDSQTRFDLGDRSVTLSDVMVASQKASLSFEAAVQVRNKLVDAYDTISKMQI